MAHFIYFEKLKTEALIYRNSTWLDDNSQATNLSNYSSPTCHFFSAADPAILVHGGAKALSWTNTLPLNQRTQVFP
jgi:hypothetical protein